METASLSDEASLQLIGGRPLDLLATTMSDAELDKARSEIRNLLDLISTLAPMVELAWAATRPVTGRSLGQ